MTLPSVRLPHGRVWLRVADPDWADPLDPTYAAVHGGRWNAPGSFPTLYLNADLSTARAQIERMLTGSPARLEDLDDEAYVLIAAMLPRRQTCADATTTRGLLALDLPATYPRNAAGAEVGHRTCQKAGARVHSAGLRGLWCISVASQDRSGRELAWFPATPRSVARPIWADPLPLGSWIQEIHWSGIGLDEQPEPK